MGVVRKGSPFFISHLLNAGFHSNEICLECPFMCIQAFCQPCPLSFYSKAEPNNAVRPQSTSNGQSTGSISNESLTYSTFSEITVPLDASSKTTDLLENTLVETTQKAQKSDSEAKKQGVCLAKKSFLFRMFAIPLVMLGVGLSVASVVASGGAALPIAIAVIVGAVALLFVADSITACVDWRLKKNGGDGLALGADSVGNVLFYALNKLGVKEETSFAWARRVSIPYRVMLTIANLTFGAPGAGLDFSLNKPVHKPFASEVLSHLKEEYEAINQYTQTLTEKLEASVSLSSSEFNSKLVPLDDTKLIELEGRVKSAREVLKEAKKKLLEAEVKIAKKRFLEKLATSALLLGGSAMAVLGAINSGGIIAPLAFLTIGMMSISIADTFCALYHWQSIKHGGKGLPETQNSAANGMNAIFTNCGAKPDTAHKHAQRFSNFIHIIYPIFQLWPQAQLPDRYNEVKQQANGLAKSLEGFYVKLEEYEKQLDLNAQKELRELEERMMQDLLVKKVEQKELIKEDKLSQQRAEWEKNKEIWGKYLAMKVPQHSSPIAISANKRSVDISPSRTASSVTIPSGAVPLTTESEEKLPLPFASNFSLLATNQCRSLPTPVKSHY